MNSEIIKAQNIVQPEKVYIIIKSAQYLAGFH
jgi:hypothetical protein